MRVSDHLDTNTKRQLNNKVKSKRKKKKRKPSEPNFKELMGQFRDTYKRGPGGAIRNR